MEFTLYKTFPQDLEAEWNALLDESITHVPFLRYEYQDAWWQTRGGGEWPEAELAILAARDAAGRLVGIAPLFTVQHQGRPTLLNVGAIEVSDYLDLVVRPDDLPAFANELLAYLEQAHIPGWDSFVMYNLLSTSPAPAALQAAARSRGWTAAEEQLQHSPFIPLPGNWETYLAGIDKKQRHEIRRKMRRLESADGSTRWYIADQNIEEEINAFMALMEQDPEKSAFLTPTMREHMLLTARCAFEFGCINLAFLEINGKKAAGYLSFDYLNRLWVYNSGLDRSFIEYSPGWVLLGYLLQWANENGRSEFDFMRGDEDYKYKFGAIDRFVVKVTLQKPA